MSSILDALRKLEAAQVQGPASPGVWVEPPRRRRWTVAGVGAAFVAGVGLTLWLGGQRKTTPVAIATAPAAVAVTAVPAAPPVAPAPPAAAPVPVPPPAPVVAAAPPVVVAVAVPPPVAAAPAPVALPPAAPAPPLPQAVVDADPPHGRVAPAPAAAAPVALAARAPEPAPAPAPAEAAVLPRPPGDAPQIQLSFLIYSSVPERRTVALTVDGGSMTTLHEGESVGNVAVERIFTDHVQVRQGGRSFTVRAHE